MRQGSPASAFAGNACDSCDLGALYLRLQSDGHEVRVFVGEPMCHGTLAGMVPRIANWRQELTWIREAGREGIILFENVAGQRGALQDGLRRDGFNVVGGSAGGDRLENDRAYAQDVLAGLGFSTAGTWTFAEAADAERFIAARPARYVLKFNGPAFASSDNYVGCLPDGADTRAMLAARLRGHEGPASFVLMEHVEGVEMGVGAYFNGRRFLEPACLDWEHKRFFPGDLGENTGEMGTIVTYARTRSFFDRTLRKLEPLLAEAGHHGYVNLNTIVNEAGIWPLEFTCRFGYPGFAILDPLQVTPWGDIFRAMLDRDSTGFDTRPGFAAGIVLTTPPFPHTRKQVADPIGLPVLLAPDLGADERRHLHFGEVGLEGDRLVTSGIYGWTMVVTGVGATIGIAQAEAYRIGGKVFTPNVRYRNDIGEGLIRRDWARVDGLGLLDA